MNDDAHSDFWGKFFSFLRALAANSVEAARALQEKATWYLRFLFKLTIVFIIAATGLMLLLLLPTWLWRPDELGRAFSIWLVFLGIFAFIYLLFAAPLLIASRIIFKLLPGVQDMAIWIVRLLAAVSFGILILAIYFYVVPVGNNPGAIPIVLMTVLALALGSFIGWVNLNAELVKRLITLQLILLFVFATASFAFPQLIRGVMGFAARLDGLGARAVDSVNDPKPKEFQSLDEVKTFRFFSGGNPQLYYDGDLSGDFQLFDSMGRSPFRAVSPLTRRPLKPIKSEQERQQVIAWYEHHFAELARVIKESELSRQKAEEEKREQARQGEERRQRDIREENVRRERERLAAQEAQNRANEEARLAQQQAQARAEAEFAQFQNDQKDKIARGIVPPLLVTASKLSDSWRLYFENTSESTAVYIIRLRKTLSGVEETTPFTKTMKPGEREYLAYQVDFHQGDVLDVFCQGFQEPYRILVR